MYMVTEGFSLKMWKCVCMYPCIALVQGMFEVLLQETDHFCDLQFDKLEVCLWCSHCLFLMCCLSTGYKYKEIHLDLVASILPVLWRKNPISLL